jgi:hypothetical protein
MPKIDFSFAGRRQISNQPPRRRLHRQDQGNAGRGDAGTDVMIFLKIFSPKNSAKKLAFLTQNKAKLCKKI